MLLVVVAVVVAVVMMNVLVATVLVAVVAFMVVAMVATMVVVAVVLVVTCVARVTRLTTTATASATATCCGGVVLRCYGFSVSWCCGLLIIFLSSILFTGILVFFSIFTSGFSSVISRTVATGIGIRRFVFSGFLVGGIVGHMTDQITRERTLSPFFWRR